jgi:hypothetical protein
VRRLSSDELRAFATPEKNILFDIDDFDGTLPGGLHGRPDAFDDALASFAMAYAVRTQKD